MRGECPEDPPPATDEAALVRFVRRESAGGPRTARSDAAAPA
jgi:hypothetical protein